MQLDVLVNDFTIMSFMRRDEYYYGINDLVTFRGCNYTRVLFVRHKT